MNPDVTPEISVVIPCHNGQAGLGACLHALYAQDLDPARFEILVVDNASAPPLSLEGLEPEAGLPAVRIVSEPRLGLHVARNSGARAAGAPLVAYTDDDVVVDRGWLAALLQGFQQPDIGAVGGEIRARWQSPPPEWVLRYAPGYLSMLDHGPEPVELKTPDLYGCNLAVRREALMAVGGFHPEAFGQHWIGDGETGMLMDMLDAGYRLAYRPDAVVHHCIPPTRCTEEYLLRRFRNQAGCDGYTWYCRELPGRRELLRSAWQHLRRRRRFSRLSRDPKASPDDRRHNRFQTAYHGRRAAYDLKLARSGTFRRMVLDRNWF